MKRIILLFLIIIFSQFHPIFAKQNNIVILNNNNCIQILDLQIREPDNIYCNSKKVWVINNFSGNLKINVYSFEEYDTTFNVVNKGITLETHIGEGVYHEHKIEIRYDIILIIPYWSYYFSLETF